MDAALEATHTGMYALLRWRMHRKHLSESLEHLASDNGADMHEYNSLYTHTLNQHVLTPGLIRLLFFKIIPYQYAMIQEKFIRNSVYDVYILSILL